MRACSHGRTRGSFLAMIRKTALPPRRLAGLRGVTARHNLTAPYGRGRPDMSTPPAAPGVFALLADGTTAEIRATPDDVDAVRGMHEAMSAENLYLRFFSLSKNAAEQEARRLCRPAPTMPRC
jgi:hypothetical protein